MSPTIDPIAPWPMLVGFGVVVLGLTVWGYSRKLSGTSGGWRWFAVGLRVVAVLMCLLATLRPSLLVARKDRQSATLVFLLDESSSMGITDEANSRSRFEVARQTLSEAMKAMGPLEKEHNLQVKALRFSETAHEDSPGAPEAPEGTATAIGDGLNEGFKQTAGTRAVAVVLLSDGQSNAGPSPPQIAQRLKAQQVPIVAVGFGSESAGAASRDLIARDLVAGPTVFVKNQPAIRGQVVARGYASQQVEVGLYVEDSAVPVATKTVSVSGGQETIPINDLKWLPQRAGETKLTLKVKPLAGELVRSNNEISTYVTVQSGGLAVLYLAGPGTVWEQKYLTRALDAAQEIQVTTRVIRRSAREDPTALPNEELAPGKYDVIILGDVPAEYLTELQQAALQRCVERGAGLMMLGGHSSFGSGGWARTPLAQVLPTEIHPGDGQLEPPDGLRVVPDTLALDSYVLRVGGTASESQRLWTALPPIPGANQLGPAKRGAVILARTGTGEPLMVMQEVPPGRVLVFGGETWPWARSFDEELQAAHRKFWRQAVLWLAHKEDQGSDQIKLALDRRRLPVGGKLEISVTARDAKGEAMTDLSYETTIERLGDPNAAATPRKVPLFNQGAESRGPYFAGGPAGEYRVSVIGRRDGKEVGRDAARFLVFQDDRELENPAADFALLRQLAEITEGKVLAPEQLVEYLKGLDLDDLTETYVQKEVRIWDNWPYLLIFATILTLEWWLRKYHGWV